MTRCHGETTLAEALADPIVQALMRADGVDPHELERNLAAVARDRAVASARRLHRLCS